MDGEIQQFEEVAVTSDAPRERIRLTLIGEFRAETPDGQSLLPVSRKARALLCIIGMARPQGALRAVAGALLWTSKHREAVANSLRQALGELQPLLASCGRPYLLATKRGRLVLDPESVWIDVLDMTPEQAALIDPTDPANTLCRDLRGISPTFDAYLDRLWVEVGYRRALAPPPREVKAASTWRDVGESIQHSSSGTARLPVDPNRLFGHPSVASLNFEKLERFPQAISAIADIPTHQLGWRMAVLPFRSLGAPLGRGIALGMAEEVSAALGRFRAPRLVSTATFWDGTGPAADAMSRCCTYQLDYIIDGTIQVVENRVRVNVNLLDVVLNFEVIWSHRFDGTLDDLFTLQDRIASETVAQVDPELHQRRWAAGTQAKTAVAEAHHAVLTAIQAIYRLERPKFMRARDLLTRAIELDPDFGAAHAWLGYWAIMAFGQGWAASPTEVVALAGHSAERAILLDPLDARALAIAGHVKAYLLRDVKTALTLHARAIELNPNLPIAWTASAWSKTYSGDHATAIRHAQMALSLSPRDPHVFFVEHALMTAHLFRRELHEADLLAEAVLARQPDHASALKVRLAILGHLERHADAAELRHRLLAIEPDSTVTKVASRPPIQAADLAYYEEGLRRAGLG
jgi:TolB-like protein/Tfp pilus assembly protein PilF